MTETTVEQARQLAQWLSGTDITLLELTGPNSVIRLCRHADAAPARATPEPPAQLPAVAAPPPSHTLVRAGSVGIVLHSHPLREDTLVQVGQPVSTGQTV